MECGPADSAKETFRKAGVAMERAQQDGDLILQGDAAFSIHFVSASLPPPPTGVAAASAPPANPPSA